MSYIYQRNYIPTASSICNSHDYSDIESVSSPLSYSECDTSYRAEEYQYFYPDNQSDQKEEQEQEQEPEQAHPSSRIESLITSMSNRINSKKELVNLIILIIYENFEVKFNLGLQDAQINGFCNLINLLVAKCNLSLSSLTKNLLILEKILLHYCDMHSSSQIPFNLLKRMVLTSFIIGTSSFDSNHKVVVNFDKWCLLTGLPSELLKHDIFSFPNSVNIGSEISDGEVASRNAMLQLQVQKYVKVVWSCADIYKSIHLYKLSV